MTHIIKRKERKRNSLAIGNKMYLIILEEMEEKERGRG